MFVNADLIQRAVVAAYVYHWVGLPQPGVERVMLDQVGREKARATSIVRFSADSSFAPPTYTLVERKSSSCPALLWTITAATQRADICAVLQVLTMRVPSLTARSFS